MAILKDATTQQGRRAGFSCIQGREGHEHTLQGQKTRFLLVIEWYGELRSKSPAFSWRIIPLQLIMTYMGHIYHLWLLTNWNWMISNLQLSSPCAPTNYTSLWHLIKIMTDLVYLLVHFIHLASIPFQNMRKSKLLSWIVDVEYILHNDRNNTIGLNRQYTRACF